MDKIVSILQDPEKIEQLILKLKTIGEDSPQFKTFETSIDSFHLNKTPRGVHQTHILQHIFKYSDSRECFDSFRLVCTSWQNAVETIRLDESPPLTIFNELCLHERNGHFPPFYRKYLKMFRKLTLHLDTNFDWAKWDSISILLLANMKNLNLIMIWFKPSSPPGFVIFLFNLFKNSESTLEQVCMLYRNVILPSISLPNLTMFAINARRDKESNVKTLMKTVVDGMCPYLKVFAFLGIHKKPQILRYITQNYPNHFVCSPEISVLEHIPLNISHINLDNLADYIYNSHIEYLILHVKNIEAPSEGGWDNYKEILSFFPNLKGVFFYHKVKCINLESFFSALHCTSQNIWQQRIDYFKSKNIEILRDDEYLKIISELRQKHLSPSWIFEFDQ